MPRRRRSKKDRVFEFEEIINHRIRPDGAMEFFVKWKGYPSSKNTWEPYSSFNAITVDEYLASAPIDKADEENDNENLRYPERIIDIRKVPSSNELLCLVQYKNCDDIQYVPTKIMNVRYSQMVIEFYERNIVWK